MYLTDKLQQTEMQQQEQQLLQLQHHQQHQSNSFASGGDPGVGGRGGGGRGGGRMGRSTGGEIEEEEEESVDERMSQSSGRTGSEFTFRATGRKSSGAQRAARLSMYRAAQAHGQMDDRYDRHAGLV